MYSNLVSAGFPSTIGMLIDTSRDGWGDPSLRPTSACPNNISSSCSTTAAFVNASKVDERPFRGDWCNPENAGIGAVPQANPDSTFPNLYAYVWVKPPGESDGTYPAYSGTGDPHCDPNGTQTDGSGNTYPTDAIPDSPPRVTGSPSNSSNSSRTPTPRSLSGPPTPPPSARDDPSGRRRPRERRQTGSAVQRQARRCGSGCA